jgi:hypothetical protein
MAAISRAQMLKELLPGLNALFGLEYNRYAEEHREIYAVDNSERSFEEETKLTGFGLAQTKREGEMIRYDTAQEAWTARYDHETVTLGFQITEEAIEDNLYDTLSSRYTKAMARSMAYTKQVKAAIPLNLGFTTYMSGDGTTLFSLTHPLAGGGAVANRATANADLNETSLEAAVIQMAAWTDDRGLLIAAKPKKLLVPPSQMFAATRILENKEWRPGTADRDINAIVTNGAIPGGYAVNHFLTDPKAFYLTTDVPDGMKMFVRVGLKTSMDGDFDTGNVRYKSRERYSFGVSDPLGIWGMPGS